MSKLATVVVAATPDEIPTGAVDGKPTTVYWNIWYGFCLAFLPWLCKRAALTPSPVTLPS